MGIQFGIYLPQVAMSFEQALDRALECERAGFDALWLYDHLYSPGQPDKPSLEAWTLATALLAKMAATLDVISGGRLELGLGSGSVAEEHHQAGLPWGPARERSERLGEALEIITRMFTGPVTTWQGRHYSVRDLPSLPPPVQQPGPPIHIGGAGPRYTLPLVARYADVWNVPTYALDRITELSAALDGECERIGRDPATIGRSVEAVLAVAPPDRLERALALARRRDGGPGFGLEAGGFAGSPAQVGDRIAELAAVGFTSFVFFTHDRASTQTLELFAAEVMPRFRA